MNIYKHTKHWTSVILAIAAFLFTSCSGTNQPLKKGYSSFEQGSYEKLIIGTWKDDNSIVNYSINKTFDGWFGKDKKRFQGYYEIVDDTFKMNFPSHQHYPQYIIENMDSTVFQIKSLDDDAVFVKRKINFVE